MTCGIKYCWKSSNVKKELTTIYGKMEIRGSLTEIPEDWRDGNWPEWQQSGGCRKRKGLYGELLLEALLQRRPENAVGRVGAEEEFFCWCSCSFVVVVNFCFLRHRKTEQWMNAPCYPALTAFSSPSYFICRPYPQLIPNSPPRGLFWRKAQTLFQGKLIFILSEKYCYEEGKEKARLNNAITEKIQTPLH